MGGQGKKYSLSVFVLAMMNVAIILNLRGLPLMAKEGGLLIFYLLFATLFFFIPTALVSAELETGWPEGGGVYRWVKEAFGETLGFVAIFLQWIQNVFWYPTVLAFVAGTWAFIFFNGYLAQHKLFNIAVILVVYWGATWINLRGIKATGWMSAWGVIAGIFIPGVLIIGLALLWLLRGEPAEFIKTIEWIPDLTKFSKISFLAGVILFFSGMEVNAVHAKSVENPKKNFPRAIFLSTGIIISLFLLGAFAIGVVLPKEEITLTGGIMQALERILTHFHMQWLLPVIGILIVFGSMANVGAWIVGPSKGLHETAKEGDLPKFLTHANRAGVPSRILIAQGVIVTLLTFAYLLMPNISSAFFLLSVLAISLYLIMYVLMFAAAIRLRYLHPLIPRAYKIPGGNGGMWTVAGLGIVGALFTIFIGFFPPEQLEVGNPLFYIAFLLICIAIALGLPFGILKFRRK